MSNLDLRVYVVTDRSFCPPQEFWGRLEEILDAGTTCLQIREKGSAKELYEVALKALPMARARKIPLIVNDRLDVAMALEADGVHLGQSDLDAGVARRLWGNGKWIGVSVANEAEVQKAERDSADHLGIGALFPTSTKADAESVSLETLERLTGSTRLPVVGIGGITPTNAPLVFRAGCRGVAVVSAIWAARKPGLVVQALRSVAEEFQR